MDDSSNDRADVIEPTGTSPTVHLHPLRRWVMLTAVSGAVILWMAMEPLGWWPLGWVALVPWSVIALHPLPPSRREYRWLWLSGTAFWLAALYGLCFAHPAMFLGWITLSVYLGAYTPLFVGLVRVAKAHRIHALLAVPMVWVGLEVIRGYAFTGFSACLLGHTQADQPIVIQVADLFGSYAVSGVLALVAAAIAHSTKRCQVPFQEKVPDTFWLADTFLLGGVCGVVVAVLGYGTWRLRQHEATDQADALGVTVALIQRNEAVQYIMPEGRELDIFDSYLQGSQDAMVAAGGRRVDLVVWPESMFTRGLPWMMLGDAPLVPKDAGMSEDQFQSRVGVNAEIWQQNAAEVQRRLAIAGGQALPPALLVGSATMRFEERTHSYSGAVFVSPQGRVVDWYGKQHLVMFGEYIPFVDWFPAMYESIPMPRVTPGEDAKLFSLADTQIAPNICFETAVECATIDQVRTLIREQVPPDVIVNLTNDAWFGGSPILDHHRRCSQFVAVSTRRPLLMASNTGPTMWVDGSGRIKKRLAKNTNGHILAQPTRDSRWGLYQIVGDWPVRPFALLVVVLAVVGLVQRRRKRQPIELGDSQSNA